MMKPIIVFITTLFVLSTAPVVFADQVSPETTGSQTIVPESLIIGDKSFCKNGSWVVFGDPKFKNQGDCVSFVEGILKSLKK